MPDGGVSSGVRPFLAVPNLMAGSSDVMVRVVDASVAGAPVQWSGRLKDGWTRIETSLAPGGAYRVEGSDDGLKWTTLGWLVVRGAWAAGGSDVSAGAVSVSSVSGGASWGWSSGGLPGPVGTGAVSLGWSSGWAVPVSLKGALPQGMPAGWRLAVGSGSEWASLLVSEQDGIARVVGWDGSVLVFVRNSSNVWVQVTGGAPGFSNEINKVDAGTWEFVSADGIITRFTGDKGLFRATRVFSGGHRLSTIAWDGKQRVASVTNEVGRNLSLTYSGGGSCPSDSWAPSGWANVPAGMLCSISYPDGTSTELAYVAGVAGSAQIGLVKDPGNLATALGWDSRGRLVAERGGFANRVATIDDNAKGVVTSLTYDSSGRAASMRLASAATHKLSFPDVDERVLRTWVADGEKAASTSPVTLKSTMTAGDFSGSKTSYVDPTSWVTIRTEDSAGAQMRMEVNERGRVKKQIDSLGRVTSFEYNDLGLVVGTTGPAIDGKAAQSSQAFDTRGTATKRDALVGLRALVGEGANRLPEFWAAAPGRGGASYSWSGRPAGWAGQATGVWDPSQAAREAAASAGGWAFQVRSEGADVTLRVNGRVCEPDQSGVCQMGGVGGGLEQVTVDLTRGQGRGFFQVLAGPRGGKLVEIPDAAVSPGFGLATESASNDIFPGRTGQPKSTSQFVDPASGRPSQVTSPGGLVSRYAYEASGWGRLTQVTTAGGATQKTTYWPDNGTATLPGVCGGASVQVSGQQKSVIRQDGSVVTNWPNLSGLVVARQTQGQGGSTQTMCMEYFADRTVRSTAIFNAEGELVERSVSDPAVGGDYRVVRTTSTKGPGAGDVLVDEAWTETRMDLQGQVVEATGSSGVTSTFTYTPLGLPSSTTTTAGDGTTLAMTYAYRAKDAQLASLAINGVKAASLVYDSFGRVTTVTYPGGAKISYSYDSSGRAHRQTVSAADTTWSHRVERTAYGRVLSESLERGTADEQRAYTYDSGTGRLARAQISGQGTSLSFDYSFAKQDASCPSMSYDPGADGLRSGGSRNGTAYVTCHDRSGRTVTTTDPLVTGGTGSAKIVYDAFGRATSVGGSNPVSISWGLGAAMTRLDQGGDDTATITMEDIGGSTILRTVTTASGTQSVRYAGPFTLAATATGAPGAVVATQYSLPGSVQVRVEDGVATATIPDLDGSAMAMITIPALAGKSTVNGALTPADRFGPYGEPLTSTSVGSAVRDYSWLSGVGLETLPGSASITIMGARPYHPALGEFLTPDPLLDGGEALYAYTSGDPINFRDPSGGSEQPEWAQWLAGIGGGLLAIIAGGAAVKAGRAFTAGGAKAASWVAGLAGAGAAAGGGYLAATSNADSDTALFAAGIAMAVVGGTSMVGGIYRGLKRASALRSTEVRLVSVAPSEFEGLLAQVEAPVAQPPGGERLSSRGASGSVYSDFSHISETMSDDVLYAKFPRYKSVALPDLPLDQFKQIQLPQGAAIAGGPIPRVNAAAAEIRMSASVADTQTIWVSEYLSSSVVSQHRPGSIYGWGRSTHSSFVYD